MGRVVDKRLQAMGGNLSTNDAKNLLFAALILADELHEQAGGKPDPARQDELAKMRAERDRLTEQLSLARMQAREQAGLSETKLAETLERLADGVEKRANALESRLSNP